MFFNVFLGDVEIRDEEGIPTVTNCCFFLFQVPSQVIIIINISDRHPWTILFSQVDNSSNISSPVCVKSDFQIDYLDSICKNIIVFIYPSTVFNRGQEQTPSWLMDSANHQT